MIRFLYRKILKVWNIAVDPISRGQRLEVLSSYMVWSVLANIGRSKSMKLTILVPLIGTFLLFNENTVRIFSFDPGFLDALGFEIDDASVIESFTIGNMYFLYFGLSALGVGSFVFNMFCPEEIKSDPYIMSHVSKVNLLDNTVVAKSNLQFVLNSYFNNERNVEADNLQARPEYPSEIEGDFYNLILEMFNASNDDDGGQSGETTEEEPGWMGDVYLPTGYPNIHEIARMVWSSPKVIWAFTMPFKDLSPRFAKDISYVMFKTLNYQQFKARIAVSILYIVGFLLLLKPTVETFIRLSKNAIIG